MFGTFLNFLFLLRKRRDDEYAVYHTLLPVGLGGLLRLGTRICRAGMIYRRSVGFGS